jgi:hypothetical protein
MRSETGAIRSDEVKSGINSKTPPSPFISPRSCSPNWLYPVVTSVSGNKSDRYIERIYEAVTTPVRACRYENRITLTHKNIYTKSDTLLIRGYMDQFGITDQ